MFLYYSVVLALLGGICVGNLIVRHLRDIRHQVMVATSSLAVGVFVAAASGMRGLGNLDLTGSVFLLAGQLSAALIGGGAIGSWLRVAGSLRRIEARWARSASMVVYMLISLFLLSSVFTVAAVSQVLVRGSQSRNIPAEVQQAMDEVVLLYRHRGLVPAEADLRQSLADSKRSLGCQYRGMGTNQCVFASNDGRAWLLTIEPNYVSRRSVNWELLRTK